MIQKKLIDEETGQWFKAVLYYQEKLPKADTVILSLPPYMGRYDDNSLPKRHLDAFAAYMTHKPILALMHPGIGSDKLTPQQRKELQGNTTGLWKRKRDQAYFSIADGQLRIIKQLGIRKLNIIGVSMGAWAGLAIAARARKYDITVKSLILIGLTSVKELSLLKMAACMVEDSIFLSVEGQSSMKLSWQDNLRSLIAVFNTPRRDILLRYARAMAHETAFDRIRMVLQTQTECSLVLVGGEKDKISPLTKLHAIAEVLQQDPSLHRARERMTIIPLPEATHFTLGHPVQFIDKIKPFL